MVSTQIVDFSNVKEGGIFNKKRVPSGDYLAVVVKVEDSPAKSDGEFQYLFTIQLKQFSQYKYPYYCKLTESQLWKLRNLLIAAGMSVPKRKQKLNPSKVVGRQIGVTMEDDEYDGKLQSNVASVFPASELSDGKLVTDDESEYEDSGMDEFVTEEAEEAEEEAEDGDEFDAMDRDQLKRYIRKNEEGTSIKRSESDDDLRDRARDLAPSDEEEEEEEEPPPPPKKKTARKTAKKKAAPVVDDDDDELEELDIDDEL